ncbi:MAG: hypothetical protein KIT85_02480 [Pseudolabrys sp.]|nr:hypothetical protein [Deltaproteobacteria bacterium]MBX3552407.1 hypothetical protein [Pseudolabrys sp.]MCW5683235.1 hypothetical protein [Pseudolabrys sp.]
MSIASSVWRVAPLAAALAAALTLGACATDGDTAATAAASPSSAAAAAPAAPAARSANAADAKVEVPLDEAQASARCWMKYDSSKMSLDQKSAAVDKCIDETMRNQRR